MSEHYPPSEPTRPLPPYRPAGPLGAAAEPEAPRAPVAMFSPIPSQNAPVLSVAAARAEAEAQAAAVRPARSIEEAVPGAPPSAFLPTPQTPTRPYVHPQPGTFLPQEQPAPAAAAPAPAAPPERPEAPAAAAPAPGSRRAAGPSRSTGSRDAEEGDIAIDEVLTEMVRLGASDAHLTTGSPPMVRVSGSLRPLEGFPALMPEPLRRTLFAILTQKQREKFEANLELDISYAVRGLARFRVNIYQQRESIGAAFRVIPYEIKPLEALGVPAVVGNFAGLPRGLVLVTGPTGSGKSTTLASIVDLANRTREDHIMTVEDPIEFLHRHKKSLVNQREVGQDTHSFANALKHVLRQDPDIILVGEMRDLETISVALTAAETGHLVFATLHTSDAAQTIDRVIDVFPAHQQDQVRTQLAGALQGVVCQTLCKRADTPGRAVATEVLVATPAIRNLIREGKTHQIYSAMQAGAKQGMHTMDQHLADLVKTGKISYEVGLEKCHHVEDFNRLTGRFSGAAQGASAMNDPMSMGGSTNSFGQVL
ncbi:type IV pilus twitching motility protein PilT [Cellulomonas edaphi]|uniref:Type IV pilus twitching motility protein PilT n=1 Tax=Cellulomonas edaphi TaxID=3053468 RepID=A0ABT7S6J7_9CELL|nr:type IV pilus twitching motility protein PilT [Cellulomons edaphi]MDM7831230.1 type IV pilus twitching motility protein PilT [Cellulomons edaphi]